MNSQTTNGFWKLFDALPLEVQDSARATYQLFEDNPAHPSLHFKKVHSGRSLVSARVSLSWRVVGVREGETIVWFWIGSHPEYDKLLARL